MLKIEFLFLQKTRSFRLKIRLEYLSSSLVCRALLKKNLKYLLPSV